MDSQADQDFVSIITDITFLASSTDWDSEISSLYIQLFSADSFDDKWGLATEIYSLKPKMEFTSLTRQIISFCELSSERKLISLTSQIIFFVSFMDLDSQLKPESELISLIKQITSLFNSKPDLEDLVSVITQTMGLGISVDSDSELTQESELLSLISQLVSLVPKAELTSLISRIISRFRSMNWEPMQFISFCPQASVLFDKGKFCMKTRNVFMKDWKCPLEYIEFSRSKRQIHFVCHGCHGEKHGEYEMAPVQAKHPLHGQHSLRLVYCIKFWLTRKCYCCDEDLASVFYYCQACDYAMNFTCAEKPPPVLSIDHPKRHEHPLSPFPSHDSLTCHLCSLKDSSCLFYICPPCGFVVHQKCLSLPHVIRISRHRHRISFTPSFDKGIWFCSVCRRKINSDYGGYSCIKDGCSYVAHSRCATQSNVWDGIELEEVPEETEEEGLESFVRISDGIIQHFIHQHHHLRHVENTYREYNKMCQACILPIYFGNFYSCMTCDFILHEDCANMPRKIHHAIHPHTLTLVGGYDGMINYWNDRCSACHLVCTCGFFYECSKKECGSFRLHVQCATISEPLVRGDHMHPLFLTSKPKEERTCLVCKCYVNDTFNCIEECDFSLCFKCATVPQKVRYKHDKHILHLTYVEETSTLKYWCEACEKIIKPKKRFYKCDEYCCVTLHIKCLIGKNLYMKPGSSFVYSKRKVVVLPNNQHMSRPICSRCEMRCPFTIAFKCAGKIFCSTGCLP